MVLTKRKGSHSDTDLTLNNDEATVGNERNKLQEVTEELQHEVDVLRKRTEKVRWEYASN